ncbi:TIGR00730 family Rossman fold protein [Niallia sp. 01092]|uniref:TIGR00730 family Rossman fold protein n=1 Tax=unclassified Niallia TaxID=2837522 RepID=UPI003FD5E35C
MKRIAVFCGSSNGASPIYLEGAKALGRELAKRSLELVYGGSSIGLMGAVADAVLQAGGKAIGVLPNFLAEKELAHKDLTELIVVDSMHERKAKMAELADGFITLPGGAGTLEEFFEIYTWAQLGLHQKPCGILNTNHYYDPLIRLIHHMVDAEFLQEKFRNMALVDANPETLLNQLNTYTPPTVKIFLTENQT